MKRWHNHFLGTQSIPKDISEFEVMYFFSFDSRLRKTLESRRRPENQLALALHLGFLRMSGRNLDAFERIPRVLLKHLSRHLQIKTPDLATLATLYRRQRTLHDHQKWAAQKLGFKTLSPQRSGALYRYLREQSECTLSVDSLVQDARGWLYHRKVLLPGFRPLQDVARRAFQASEIDLNEKILKAVSKHKCKQLIRELLSLRTEEGISHLEWLQLPPKKTSITSLNETVEKVTYLRELGEG